ncbi:MAG: cell envelope integrity protein CreD [Bacteroidota bacterium]
MNPAPVSERINTWLRTSITLKLIVMGILILLLLIPAAMIGDLIRERERLRDGAIAEVSQRWGAAQSVTGPVLAIPYTVVQTVGEGDSQRTVTTTQYAYFLPDDLQVTGRLDPQLRHRGLHEVVVYTSNLNVEGHFPQPDFSEWDIEPDLIRWDEATVLVGLPDLRSINESISMDWNTAKASFEPGVAPHGIFASGITARVPLQANGPPQYDFTFALDLNGSQSMYVAPLGRETNVRLEAPWADPSFDGAFLPDDRQVTPEGFSADWRVLHLNRSYPQRWRGTNIRFALTAEDAYTLPDPYASPQVNASAGSPTNALFGVRLLLPVDQYRKTTRASKYGLLIITLTFLAFFFAEIRRRVRVHPFQYLLVGLALCLFYALLLSFSEHLSFLWSYLLTAGATLVLITGYSKAALKSSTLAGITGGLLVFLYGFVFILLQLQDYALLIGSIGLFIILALVMYASRQIDWYAPYKKAEPHPEGVG